MADGKGPSGWERGLRAGVFCPVCLHRPWLRPAARPADTAAARRDGDGHGADGLMGAKLQSPMCSLRGPCVLPARSPCVPCVVPTCSLRGPRVFPAWSLRGPHVPVQPQAVRAGGAQLCPSIAATLGAGRTLGAKPPRAPRSWAFPLGTPLPFQAAGQGETEHGEEEEGLHVGDSVAALASAGLCGCGQRRGTVLIPTGTPSPRRTSARDNAPCNVNTGLWQWR